MRDKLKTADYFNMQIINISESIYRKSRWIETGEAMGDQINNMQRLLVWDYLCVINCKYSLGLEPRELKADLISAINLTYYGWVGDSAKFVDRKGVVQDSYHMSTYEQMLWMLSLGYLLDIPNCEFKKLIDVIDRDHVRNSLYEFIIRAKIPDRMLVGDGDYEKEWILFAKLRQAITATNKDEATGLVKYFVVRDWYKEHRSSGWYGAHLSPYNLYYGYWSYETAAVVKIMGLDDSSFKDCKYYPADMVHYAADNVKV